MSNSFHVVWQKIKFLSYHTLWQETKKDGGDLEESKHLFKCQRRYDFADVTLACGDDHRLEAHRVILDEQVLFNRLLHSRHHININNVNVIVE